MPSLKHRKNKKRYAKSKLSKKNDWKFWRKYRLGFKSKAQAKRAFKNRKKD
tara:strand:- start:529 stop:681 length:153 start_codon:yes stop_codon:yes gene_type:complete